MLMPGNKFDAGRSSPMLHAVISRAPAAAAHAGAHGVEGRRVLVPGCGRGYDVVSFAAAGASEAVGLEIAPTGNAEAQKVLLAAAGADGAAPRGRCSVVDTDFFALPSSPAYDIVRAARAPGPPPSRRPTRADPRADADRPLIPQVYDYTFFCALHPSRRPRWAATMAAVVKPGGQLWTMIFPISDHEGGPPFAVSPDAYRSLLLDAGFEERSLAPVPEELSHSGRASKEAFAVWERRRQ